MKRLMIAVAVLALMATTSHARMRHDRPCDIAQDKADPVKLNPPGGNGILFYPCDGVKDAPIGDRAGRPGWWKAFNCGYQAYRQCKVSDLNPYLNEHLQDGWDKGWEAARKACTTGRRPFYPYPKKDDARSEERLMATAVLPLTPIASPAPRKKWCR